MSLALRIDASTGEIWLDTLRIHAALLRTELPDDFKPTGRSENGLRNTYSSPDASCTIYLGFTDTRLTVASLRLSNSHFDTMEADDWYCSEDERVKLHLNWLNTYFPPPRFKSMELREFTWGSIGAGSDKSADAFILVRYL